MWPRGGGQRMEVHKHADKQAPICTKHRLFQALWAIHAVHLPPHFWTCDSYKRVMWGKMRHWLCICLWRTVSVQEGGLATASAMEQAKLMWSCGLNCVYTYAANAPAVCGESLMIRWTTDHCSPRDDVWKFQGHSMPCLLKLFNPHRYC